MSQKKLAVKILKALKIFQPYIKEFEKTDTICLFERLGGFYIDEDNEPVLYKKIKDLEKESGAIVYAVTHEHTNFGEMYDFLIVPKYEEEWDSVYEYAKQGICFAYVWNKSYEDLSEYGDIQVTSCLGGIARIS